MATRAAVHDLRVFTLLRHADAAPPPLLCCAVTLITSEMRPLRHVPRMRIIAYAMMRHFAPGHGYYGCHVICVLVSRKSYEGHFIVCSQQRCSMHCKNNRIA